MLRSVTILGATLAVTLSAPSLARVTTVRIDRVEPFAAGTAFGATGAYERVIGVARGELDPADPRNAVITDLARAPRNAAGKVEYETDLFLLRPADPARGNHHLLFDVLNRGNKVVTGRLNMTLPSEDSNDPATAAQAGDGFLFRRGYTVAWAGWDPDSPTSNHGMVARIPALAGVEQDIRDEFVSGTRGAPRAAFHLSYAAVTDAPARLTVRARQADAETGIPAAGWHFVDARTIALLPDGTKPALGWIYELTYRARSPWVSGIGFAIERDVAAYLKSNAPDAAGTANPGGGRLGAAIGFGVSQSGRFLRDFIKLGFNQDEQGRRVFDGVLSHIAGIGGMFLNTAFAQPFRTRTQHEDHTMPENAFPFSAARTHDPASGQDGALLRGDRFDPKLIETNTDAEYWQKGASLLSTDPLGQRDVALPAGARVFLISGSQHTGRYGATDAPGLCVNRRNPHDPYPALRALLAALDDWITTGRPAPDSRVPRIADHTLVPAGSLQFPALPGFAVAAAPDAIDPPGDWVHPAAVASPYRPLVPAVDADGNDRAGLRLPDIAVPLGTYTGFNLYAVPKLEGEMCDRDGSSLAFARTGVDRAAGDRRRSLVARYGSVDRYGALVRAEADRLVRARLLLPEDADRYAARAKTAF
jgi:hypothetical protein